MRNKRSIFEGVQINDYKFREKVGEGNWATVYLVNRISTKDIYAVKVIDQSLFKKHPTLKELINTEISILKYCKNPNVVGFIEQLVYQNHQLIVLEYCNGENLGEKLQRQGKIEEQKAVQYLKQIMNGFKGLHEIKAMHRDFKADNVMLHNNSCKIVDLGFGKLLQEEDDLVLSKLGTKFTMAPEVLQGLPYDMKADIWSIGAVYYQLLVGQYPFIANSVQGLLDKAIVGPKFPKSQKISENSKNFIEKCLTYQPSQRVSWSQLYAHPLLKENKNDNQNKNLIRIQEINQFNIENNKQINKSIVIKPTSQTKKIIIRNDDIENQSKIGVDNIQKQFKICVKPFLRAQFNKQKEKNIENISINSFQDEESKLNTHKFKKQKKQTEQQKNQRIIAQEQFQINKNRIMKQIQKIKRKYIQEEARISFISQYLIKYILLDKDIIEKDHLLIACFILKQTIQKLTEIQESILKRKNIFRYDEFPHFINDGIGQIESYYKSKIESLNCYFSQMKTKISKISKQYEIQIFKLTIGSIKQKQVELNLHQYEKSLRRIVLEIKQRSLKTKLLKWSFCYNQYLRYRLDNINYHKINNAISHFDERRAEENLIKKQQLERKPIRVDKTLCFSSYRFSP